MPQRECLSINIGQAGVQVSHACWELFCLEHGIMPNGCRYESSHYGPQEKSYRTFFAENVAGSFVPRAILVDMDPTVVDEVRTGAYRHLFHPDYMLTGKEDAANNFARGFYTVGNELIPPMLDRIRRILEQCDGFQGFLVTRSLGGGCGSGYGALLMEKFSYMYEKKAKVFVDIFPSPQFATAVVEPYNTILSTHSTMNQIDVSFILDNQAMYNICHEKLDVPRPTYTNLNRLVAQVISTMTSTMRFQGGLNVELNEFQMNLVPFPRIHFPVVSYAPIASAEKGFHTQVSVNSLVGSLFDPYHQLVTCNTRLGRFMAMGLLFRGDVTPNDVNLTLGTLKGNSFQPGRIRFVDWCPTAFKIGICPIPTVAVPGGDICALPKATVGLMNTTAMYQPFKALRQKFAKMYKKRAFVHWYVGEGMEEMEFGDAMENMLALEEDYRAISADTNANRQTKKKGMDLTVKGKGVGPGPKTGPARGPKLR